MAESAMNFLLKKLSSLVEEELKSLGAVQAKIVFIKDEVRSMSAFLRVTDAIEDTDPELQTCVHQVRDLTYHTDNIFDRFTIRFASHHHRHGFFYESVYKIYYQIKSFKVRRQIVFEIKDIKTRVIDIAQRRQRYNYKFKQGSSSNVANNGGCNDRRGDALLLEESELVGFQKPKNQLIDWVLDGDSPLKIEELLKDLIQQLFDEVRQPLPQRLETMDNNKLKAVLKEFLQERSILRRCEGLPLAIVAIAGVLASKDQGRVHEWELVNCNLGAEVEDEPMSESSILLLFNDGLSLLKVLDLRNICLERFPGDVVKLFHLRYLSLRGTKVKALPNSIGLLWNPETLDLKNAYVKELPVEILRLQKLHHLLLYCNEIRHIYFPFHQKHGFEAPSKIGDLQSLQKLCFIEVNHVNCNVIVKEIGRLTKLRRLGISKLMIEDEVGLCSSIEKIRNLLSLDVSSIEDDEILDLQFLSPTPQFLQ
ncbi:disease resistance protein Pik-2-like [Camellia sinensis]|uniref:disease resistance protein Pik-2-like n=1 Tax=Camellia sinensis TaxID=4442 RepID=UPI001036E9DE|nr:disease resistance protein Pik-2-like [Camellia sinensis]